MGVSKISNHIQTKIKMMGHSQEIPESSQAPNKDLEDMGALSIFKIKIESKNVEHGCTKDQQPYTNPR